MQTPTGMVTFLFTDIEGSSSLWERYPINMGPALARHDELLRDAIEARGGIVFKTVGDAFCAAFSEPHAALDASLAAQKNLAMEDWGNVEPLRVRMGLHAGSAEFRNNDYFGSTVNRTARISSAGHGGQILVSQALVEMLNEMPERNFSFVPLGDFRLRNLDRIERIYQVNTAGLQSVFPPLRSQQNLPHNLPASTTSFIGRTKEIEKVKELLSRTRTLTLIGTGGTGKTRLAIESGRELLENYPDGVWLVELATMDEDSSLLAAIASTLGVREEPGQSFSETLYSYLRGRGILLILDNCEHIVELVVRETAGLIASCPKLSVLATSRQALHLAGEITLPVRPLGVFDVWQRARDQALTAENISTFDAVQLFVERARAIAPTFELNDNNAPAVARICWRLDGIPLALELAAARLRILTPEQIAERLNDQFYLLKGKGQAALPHQQTLRTLIDWSHDLLDKPEKILFRRLGVFAGGRTLEAVESVCSGGEIDDILDLLQQLADKSLVFVESDNSGSARYTLLESVWQYAREKLRESGEFDDLQNRHLEHFLHLAEKAVPYLSGPDPASWIKQLTSETLNLRFALEWAAERSSHDESGLRLVAALERFWEICGNLEEARRLGEAILARPDCAKFPIWHARALMSVGRIAWAQDRYEEGQQLLERARGIFESIGEHAMFGLACGYLGFLAWSQGNKEQAQSFFDSAAQIAQKLGDRRILAIVLAGRGSIATGEGDLISALEIKREALGMFRSIGDKWIVGYSLWGVAQAALALGHATEAREALNEWTQIANELGNRWAAAYILQHLADAARIEKKPALSARIFGAAENLRKKLGIRFSPIEQATYNASIAALRTMLPSDQFETYWEAGLHLRVPTALEIALAG